MYNYNITHLRELEAESIYVIREVAAQFEKPAMLFSGGKDSIVMFHLARKAFYPSKLPFPLLHIDTGHNFQETLEFRDNLMKETGTRLEVRYVEDSIKAGKVAEETGPNASRNKAQTVTLLDAIEELKIDAAMGGGRRDEEKARAKERFFSHRDDFGQWDPKNQRPELWNLFNGRKNIGEHFRVFPISNWTELDVWQYIKLENIAIPELYFTHEREVVDREGTLLAKSPFVQLKKNEKWEKLTIRFRTIGDMTCTGAVKSPANSLEDIINEIAASRVTERGGRFDDKRSEAAMEDRKKGRVFLGMNAILQNYEKSDLLRFTTAGSVDDGKSTLIGRLLYDSKAIFEDQLEAIEQASLKSGDGNINLALLTDGLRAEREQGITIDVAYRYFATPKRKFIIADTPGHVQYTRNMVTGASTANAAIILIDARHGVIEQTLRHAFIASLLQIPHVIICINKMDLVDYSEERFEQIHDDFMSFSAKLDIQDIRFVPISALKGDNVVDRSTNMTWYNGPTLMYLLETIYIASDNNHIDTRFPVQYVVRPQTAEFPDYRGYAGRIAGGSFKKGDRVLVLPSGFTSKIKSIDLFGQQFDMAHTPQSVTITLEDEIDISRGDMIVRENNVPQVEQDIDMMICWLNEKPMVPGGKYALKHTTNDVRCMIKEVKYKININTLDRDLENKQIGMNDIGRITIRTTKPLYFDAYRKNRITGSVILVDEATNETVCAGMIM